jgi:GNAT superfamily N-acetyltransferase
MEWYLERDVPYEANLRSYRARARLDRVPLTLVALRGSLPVGMVSLKENDLWTRRDLNPWLASLLVVEEFRGQGIGRMLIKSLVSRARDLELQRMYLFLDSRELERLERFYTSLGWRFLEDAVDNEGKDTKIFYYDL